MNINKMHYNWERALDSRWFGYAIQAIVCVSVALYVYECDALHTANSRVGPSCFLWIERTIASILTLEYLMRLYFAHDKKHYITRNRGIIDFLAIAPFWIGFFVPATWLGAIRACRTLRLMKFYRYNEVMQCLLNEFRQHDKAIKVVMLLTMIFILFMSCVLFELEKTTQPDKFGSILGCMWFSIVTVATVGFGDMYPIATVSKFFTSGCIFIGVSLYASWLAIVGVVVHSAFSKLDEEDNKKEAIAQLIHEYAPSQKE